MKTEKSSKRNTTGWDVLAVVIGIVGLVISLVFMYREINSKKDSPDISMWLIPLCLSIAILYTGGYVLIIKRRIMQ